MPSHPTKVTDPALSSADPPGGFSISMRETTHRSGRILYLFPWRKFSRVATKCFVLIFGAGDPAGLIIASHRDTRALSFFPALMRATPGPSLVSHERSPAHYDFPRPRGSPRITHAKQSLEREYGERGP